jgi:TonB family protein
VSYLYGTRDAITPQLDDRGSEIGPSRNWVIYRILRERPLALQRLQEGVLAATHQVIEAISHPISKDQGKIGSYIPLAQDTEPRGVNPKGVPLVDLDYKQAKVKSQPPMPPYPPIARMAKVQGLVTIALIVDREGVPQEAEVESGPPMLRAVAESYAMGWRFEPTELNGARAAIRVRLTLNFSLGSR